MLWKSRERACGPLVHPRLRTRSWKSADSRHPDALSSLQSSWRSRYAKDSEGDERVDKTDTVDESLAPAVDDGGSCIGDSLASPETRGRRSDRTQLCGLPSTWGTGNAAGAELGGTDQTRKYRSDRPFFPCDSGGSKRYPEQNAHVRRLGNPRQTRPLVDGSAFASSDNGRPGHALLIPVSQNDLAYEIKNIFEELGCSKLAIVAYSLRHGGPSWDFMKKFRSFYEIQQRGRWRSLSSVLRYQKASKLLSAMQLVQPRQAEFGRVLRGQSRAPPRRPHGRPIFPWTGHRCFIEIGNAAASVSRAVKRRGVLAETWSSWYGTRQDISVEKNRTLLLRRIRQSTIAGIFMSPFSHTFSRARKGKVDGSWSVAFRNNSCPEGFSWLEGSMREAVSRANSFANTCADVVLEGIRQGIPVALFHMTGSYMWSLDAYCRLRDLNPTISHLDWCQFGCRFRGRTTIWSWNLEVPTVLPTCNPRGNICSWSEEQHQHWKPPTSIGPSVGYSLYPTAFAGHYRLLVLEYLGTECPALSMEFLPPFNP